MKTKLTIVNDVHIGSKYCDDPKAMKKLNRLYADSFTFLNGDIVDMSCCPEKDVQELREYQEELIRKWGSSYISGNHDLLGLSNITKFIVLPDGRKVLFTHGDLVKDKNKWTKYRSKEPGANWLKLIWVSIADTQDWVKNKINTKKLEPMFSEAVTWANKFDCDYVIMGHLHNTKVIDETRNNVRIMILPPGFNEIWI